MENKLRAQLFKFFPICYHDVLLQPYELVRRWISKNYPLERVIVFTQNVG